MFDLRPIRQPDCHRSGLPALRGPALAHLITAFVLVICPGLAVAATPEAGSYSARVSVDLNGLGNAPRLGPTVFGVNWNWLDNGGVGVEYGELVRDRSFRNQADAAKRMWLESPNAAGSGSVKRVDTGGDDKPWGVRGYPGYIVLSQRAVGYTCVSQQVIEELVAGQEYELHVSARGLAGTPLVTAFFADQNFTPVESLDKLAPVTTIWTDYTLVLRPDRALASGYLRVCNLAPGDLAIDEVRLQRRGGTVRVRDAIAARISQLGVRSLRWPTGSDADYFDWREAVGPLRNRGENPSAFGALETPSLGLHEFLNYCEQASIVPLITVNVREPATRAGDLVEYILGAPTTPMGALRVRNGRPTPWQVVHFELGNEPVEAYKAEFSTADAAKGYVGLASAVAAAMRAKAAQAGKVIELKGVVETTFANSDWIKLVPILANWNKTVLDKSTGLLGSVNHVKGHFYGPFNWRVGERDLFEEAMGSATTLAATVRRLGRDFGPLPPFWLTEYGILVQKKVLLSTEIQLDRAKDLQAGLVAADLMMTAMRESFGGAYLFNLAQWGTWGVFANPRDLRLRPSGLAFAMLSKLYDQRVVPTTVEGGNIVTLKSGDGNNPVGTAYPTLSAVAAASDQGVHVALLNRSYDRSETVWVDLKGATPTRVDMEQLDAGSLAASNDVTAGTVSVRTSNTSLSGSQVVSLPSRSLIRLYYTAPIAKSK